MDPKIDDEIFISYAHIDNQPPKPTLEGWVTRFHERLERRITEARGKPARVFRDPKLQGNDVFNDVLAGRLQKTGVLLSILTNRYLLSSPCLDELHQFTENLLSSGTLVVGEHKSRIFKIVKTPPDNPVPKEMEPLLGYEFFRLDAKGRPQEFDELYGPDSEREFWVRLNDLAYDLADSLKILESGPDHVPPKPAVYLAETTADLRDRRDALRRDLLRHGYPVLPASNLPLEKAEIEAFLHTQLTRCKVSVHLLGSSYGTIPEGSEESFSVIQNRIAREFGKRAELARLGWIGGSDPSPDPRQEAFLDNIRNDPGLDEGAD